MLETKEFEPKPMTLEEFARLILFGTQLEDKLTECSTSTWNPVWTNGTTDPSRVLSELSAPCRPIEVPAFPGRPPRLAKPGKAAFPSIYRLHEPLERGKVLHFFANHELLAMELMALLLLRFPEAPPSFRRGIAGIIQEEQSHLRLYISRMRELGIEFGDLPVNDYFWNSMKGMQSPLDFTVQMSLTFEQANLDFSLFFRNEIQKADDPITATLLDRVFREEIGHVKHGVTWFNRWRRQAANETDWEAYVQLLPLPMTPQRAKGYEFCESARREAGLSEIFIRELRLYSGSKGRPPVVWFYNPHCDSEIARGVPGFTPTRGAEQISRDLEATPVFLCHNQDVVLVHQRPDMDWIESLQKAGFQTPEFIEIESPDLAQSIRAPKISGIEPWGWSPEVFDAFKPLGSRWVNRAENDPFCKKILSQETFTKTGLGQFFSKSWSVHFLQEWLTLHPSSQIFFGTQDSVGSLFYDIKSANQRIHEIMESGHSVMAKAPYGTAGMQVKKINHPKDLLGPYGGWIKNTLKSQGAIVIERWLDKLFDLSVQLEIHTDRIQILEVREFITGKHHEYRGTYLGKKLQGFTPEHLQFFHSALPEWHRFLRDLGTTLRNEGYQGPAGVDALLWKSPEGALQLKPMVELNPRWTMGRVALELEKHLAPGLNGLWTFITLGEIISRGFPSAKHFAEEMQSRYPVKKVRAGSGQRIESGVVFTNDPSRVQSVLTVLATLPNPDLLENETVNHAHPFI